MSIKAEPLMAVYVAWHPSFEPGAELAKTIFYHYRRDLIGNVAGGLGIPVLYRCLNAPDEEAPERIRLDEACTTAIIVLLDKELAADENWSTWVRELADATDAAGLSCRFIPVCMDAHGLSTGVSEQAIRWDRWEGLSPDDKMTRLLVGLSYAFCRMLRSYIEGLQEDVPDEKALERYLKKVEIFLSHSKHDDLGEVIAGLIRDRLCEGAEGMSSFFDVYDIPAGLRFHKVILQKVRTSAVLAIRSDTYSSREWCRKEIIEAKLANVPLVVVDCLSDREARSFPYMGNVPVLRITDGGQIEDVISLLLDELLRDFLWRSRLAVLDLQAIPHLAFLPRPPELISLASEDISNGQSETLVYPEPPIGLEERELFRAVAPDLRIMSINDWLAGAGS